MFLIEIKWKNGEGITTIVTDDWRRIFNLLEISPSVEKYKAYKSSAQFLRGYGYDQYTKLVNVFHPGE